jgi:hypothetical protein
MRQFKPSILRLITRCGVLLVVGADIQNVLWACSVIKLHIICRQPIGSAAIAVFEPCKYQGSPELYLRVQFVPRSKHAPFRLQNQPVNVV